ncbi:MAG: hypothetical protein M0Z66_07925 [Thermaerobacter sp.]|nr:hypothetical protein [Thermaerobacter sp.]
MWIILIGSVGFAVCYVEGGLPDAVSFGGVALVFWGWDIIVIGAIFSVLSLVFSAWPGKRAFWLAVTQMAVITTVPGVIVTAVQTAQIFPNPAPAATQLGNYLLLHNWPEIVSYDLVLAGVTAWIALLHFPRIRGWRLLVFWTVTVVVCTAIEIVIPVR